MCDELAAQKPWWKPGSAHGYHGLTFGWLIGELVRRVDGRTLGVFFQEEIARPLQLDAYIGCDESLDARIADVITERAKMKFMTKLLLFLFRRSLPVKAMLNPPAHTVPDLLNSRNWRALDLCSSTGHTNARSLSRFYAALAAWSKGECFEDHQLISQSTMEQARTEHSSGRDRVLRQETRIALGFWLPCPHLRFSNNLKAFGHAGMGRSLGFADPENQLSFGYAMNKVGQGDTGGDARWWGMLSAMYEAVGCEFTPPSPDE